MRTIVLIFTTLISTAQAAEPPAAVKPPAFSTSEVKTVNITYSAVFDFIDPFEKVACQTGLCDCDAVYEGTGALHASGNHTYTFHGIFMQTSGECHDNITFWSPIDGKSYHTLHFNPEETHLVHWVAHKKSIDKKPFPPKQGIKENGQCYISEMLAPIKPNGVVTHTESDTAKAGPFNLTSTHTLSITMAQ